MHLVALINLVPQPCRVMKVKVYIEDMHLVALTYLVPG